MLVQESYLPYFTKKTTCNYGSHFIKLLLGDNDSLSISNSNLRMINSAGRTTANPISTIILPSSVSCAVIVFPNPTRTVKSLF